MVVGRVEEAADLVLVLVAHQFCRFSYVNPVSWIVRRRAQVPQIAAVERQAETLASPQSSPPSSPLPSGIASSQVWIGAARFRFSEASGGAAVDTEGNETIKTKIAHGLTGVFRRRDESPARSWCGWGCGENGKIAERFIGGLRRQVVLICVLAYWSPGFSLFLAQSAA